MENILCRTQPRKGTFPKRLQLVRSKRCVPLTSTLEQLHVMWQSFLF